MGKPCVVLRFREPCELYFWFHRVCDLFPLPPCPTPHGIFQDGGFVDFLFGYFFTVKERSHSVCVNARTIFPLQPVLSKLLGVSSFCPYHLLFFSAFAF